MNDDYSKVIRPSDKFTSLHPHKHKKFDALMAKRDSLSSKRIFE